MRTRKPEAGRVPCEDASSAAIRSLRGHLEMEEIEAALGVYRQARQAITGWRPPRRKGSLPQPLEALRRQLIHQAEQLRADGVLELGDEV